MHRGAVRSGPDVPLAKRKWMRHNIASPFLVLVIAATSGSCYDVCIRPLPYNCVRSSTFPWYSLFSPNLLRGRPNTWRYNQVGSWSPNGGSGG